MNTTTTNRPACIITFRAKIQESFYTDGTYASRWIQVPKLTRGHVDVSMARASRKYGNYANSDLFLDMLNGALRSAGFRERDRGMFRFDPCNPPAGTVVDESGFLATVTITIDDV